MKRYADTNNSPKSSPRTRATTTPTRFTTARLRTHTDPETGCSTFVIPEGQETAAAALCEVQHRDHGTEQATARGIARFLNTEGRDLPTHAALLEAARTFAEATGATIL